MNASATLLFMSKIQILWKIEEMPFEYGQKKFWNVVLKKHRKDIMWTDSREDV